MDSVFAEAVENFFDKRINWHGENVPDAVSSVFMELDSYLERLSDQLPKEKQKELLTCVDACHIADAETSRFYYKAGFFDALRLLSIPEFVDAFNIRKHVNLAAFTRPSPDADRDAAEE